LKKALFDSICYALSGLDVIHLSKFTDKASRSQMNSVNLRLRSTLKASGIEYNSAFKERMRQSVISKDVQPRLDEVLKQAKALSAQDRTQLIKELQRDREMSVIFGNVLTITQILIQIKTMAKADISRILRAIADRLASEK